MSTVVLLILLVSGLGTTICAEEPSHPSKTGSLQDLEEEFTVIGSCRSDKTAWSLSIEHADPEYPLKSGEDVINALQQRVESDRGTSMTEKSLVKREMPALTKLMENMSLIGHDLGRFLYADTILIPVRFAQKNSLTTLIITGIASETVYNTLRTTSKSRAAKVVQSMIIPSMPYFVTAFKASKIHRYAMCVTYGSKDFLEGDVYGNLQPEIVAFVVPANAARRFVKGEITEEELLDASDAYLSDRDLRLDFKKVKLTFE
ncbi:MAG: hypothetical protein V1784_05365 [bacterium]